MSDGMVTSARIEAARATYLAAKANRKTDPAAADAAWSTYTSLRSAATLLRAIENGPGAYQLRHITEVLSACNLPTSSRTNPPIVGDFDS